MCELCEMQKVELLTYKIVVDDSLEGENYVVVNQKDETVTVPNEQTKRYFEIRRQGINN